MWRDQSIRKAQRRFPGGRGVLAMAAVAVAAMLLAGCGSETPPSGQAGAPPPAVVVETARMQDLVEAREFIGRIEAVNKVQLRARVQGFLEKQLFEEGAEVHKDQVLFEIERERYEIEVAEAEANLAAAAAAQELARLTFERTDELVKQNAISKASLDTAQSELEQARAAVRMREAALRSAKLNLDYTRIAAPIDGGVGRVAYSVGNLVGPESGPLVTLVAQDPMYVTFPVPQHTVLAVRKAGQGPESFTVRLRLADGSEYEEEGRIRFAEVQATPSTDTVTVRASIANPKRLLIDQQLVNVVVVPKTPDRKLVVSQSGLLLDQQGAYVLVVDAENKVAIRRITTGEQWGPQIVVLSGLADGEQVIVSGHQKVTPGATVAPQQAETAGRAK